MAGKTAIIGAGLAGLSCAQTLKNARLPVEIFERTASIGGRIATTRVNSLTFDHGAQYVSARTPQFSELLTDLTGLGCAAGWSPRVEQGETQSTGAPESSPWIVGTPGMASLLRPLAEGMRITTGRRVRQLERRGKDWHLWFDDESSAGPFQAVAVTVPANEAARLLVHVPVLSDALASVRMEPCWTLMIATQNHVMPPVDVMHNVSKSIRWLTRDNTKPGRNPRGDAMVILGSAQWNEGARHLDPQAAAEELWADACDALSLAPLRPSHMIAHLWRDGLTTSALGQSHLFAKDQNAGVAGDWCRGATAEDAFESGTSLGRAMVAALT